jgi:hypothetical protein
MIAPGASPGILTVGTVTTPATVSIESGAKFKFQYAPGVSAAAADTGLSAVPGPGGNSELVVNGGLSISNGSVFVLTGSMLDFVPTNTYSFLIGSATTVSPFSVTNPSQFDTTGFAGYTGQFAMEAHNVGTNVFLNFSPVPEPGSALLAAAGAGVLALNRRRRRVA